MALALLLLPILALHRFLFEGALFFLEDAGDAHYPFLELLRNCLHAGHVPLWNPYILSGQSFSGHTNTPIYYPLNYVVYWMPADRYIVWTVALHMGLAGLGMACWAHKIGFSDSTAFLAGLSYGMSTPICSDVERFHIAQILAMLPWFLIFLEASFARAWCVGPAALLLGLQILCAHPQHVHLEALLCCVLLVGRWSKLYPWKATLGRSVLIGGLALGISCIYWLQQLEQFTINLRSLAGLDYYRVYGATVASVLGALTATQGYAFPLSLFALALVGVWVHRQGPMPRISSVALVLVPLGLVLALGNGSPIEGLLRAVVPLYAKLRYRHRYLFLTILGLMWLGLLGYEWLLRRARQGRLPGKNLLPGLAIALVGLQTYLLCAGMNLPFSPKVLEAPAFDLIPSETGFFRVLTLPSLYRKYWDWGMVRGVRNIEGFVTNDRVEYQQLLCYAVNGRLLNEADAQTVLNFNSIWLNLPPHAPLFRILGLKYALSSPGQDQPPQIEHIEGGVPQAFLCPRWRGPMELQEIFALLSDPHFQPVETALLRALPAGLPATSPNDVSRLTAGSCETRMDDVNSLKIRAVNPLQRSVVLVVSEAYEPGWHARIDGLEVPLFEVDGVLRGVVCPPGTHQFVLYFWPASLAVGLAVSLSSLALAAGLSIWLWRRPAPESKEPAGDEG